MPPSPAADPEPNGGGREPPDGPGRGERINFGDPLPPDWAQPPGASAGAPSGSPPPPRSDPPPSAGRPAGADSAGGHRHEQGRECLEWCPVCRSAEIVRASIPPELRSQLEGVQRDALVAVRALLDHYIDRIDGSSPTGSRVEDIPIE